MQAVAKMLPIEQVEIRFKHDRTKLFHIPKKDEKRVAGILEAVLSGYEVVSDEEKSVPAEEVFPELLDDVKRPAIVLRSTRKRRGFSQEALAEEIGVTQSDLSKMENGNRTIGKAMAKRLASVLDTDYRMFL
jgi:ribosome-binding protein aMBF1 (putative translation factor)